MKPSRLISLSLFCALASASVALAHSLPPGPDPGNTGAPNESTCASCHLGFGLNSTGKMLSISFPDSNGYVPGQKYKLRVTLQSATARRWGFQLTNRTEATNAFAGAFAVPADSGTSSGGPYVQLQTGTGTLSAIKYACHTTFGTFAGQVTQAGWDIDWTAPAAGTGTVRFYAAGNAANNNGNEMGDRIYTADLAVAEQTSTAPAITVGNTILPQVVFGGGWYTAMYFTNQSASQVTVNVNFFTDSATQMSIGGNSTKTVLLPAGGTAVIEAQNTGSQTQGWGTFDAPAGVTGYGVFRQSVSGKADQEAVVPFTSTSSSNSLLTFDESAFTTAVALWYNGSSSGTVTLTAKDESGNVLGTSNITMTPGTKRAFAVTDSIAAISGHRGSLIVSTSSGSVAVLGLRFGGSAFTSIPASPVIN